MKRTPALAIYAVGAFLFLHLPLLILSIFSFNSSRFTVWQGFSLRWYAAAIKDTQLTESAVNSLIIATVATLVFVPSVFALIHGTESRRAAREKEKLETHFA